jgi:lipopolysaccharide transport protein LptA
VARSHPSLLCLCALAVVVASPGSAQNDDAAFEFESGPFVFDGQTNMMRAKAPLITQGALRIQADDVLATALEFDETGEFRLTGNVRIDIDTAFMEADSAVFTYAQGRVSSGELEGTPVSFTDVDAATQRRVTGRAGKISYDHVAGTLRLTGGAAVQFATREVVGCDLIYDFSAERASSGSADCEDRFRIIIRRESEAPTAAPDPPQ